MIHSIMCAEHTFGAKTLICNFFFFFCAFFPDFSGRCGPEQMKGYVTKTEYEMLGEGAAKETPQNKFNRLQHEIRELAEELEQIKVSLCLWLRDRWLI